MIVDVLDVLESRKLKNVKIGNGVGFIELVDCMPRLGEYLTCANGKQMGPGDVRVINAARKSTTCAESEKKVTGSGKDISFLRMLMRNQHTSPFEMVEFQWQIKMPIFTMRQWIRHRTANVNEFSARYAQLAPEFYVPEVDDVRKQSKVNKQGSEEVVDTADAELFIRRLEDSNTYDYGNYELAISDGIAKEQARFGLPVNIYTECVWKIDLKNLLHFLRLRCDSHAQKEIRDYADIMLEQVRVICPMVVDAWEDYDSYRSGLLLSRLEVEQLSLILKQIPGGLNVQLFGKEEDGISKREQSEWQEKVKKLLGQ